MFRKLIFCAASAFALTFSAAASAEVFFTETFAVGTIVTGQFKTKTKEEASACYRLMNDETRRLEHLLSAYDEDSDISRLGSNAGHWVEISRDTFEVLSASKTISKETNGTFDPTIGTVIKLWSVDQPDHHIPKNQSLEKALKAVGYEKIGLKQENGKFYAKIGKQQQISVGAIGKGFIADKVMKTLKDHGCRDALLSFGGNVIGCGTNAENKPWNVGLQSPDKERGNFFAVAPLDDTSIVTSGDYEKFFIENGVKYSHILDPKTGKPVPATLSSVTIIDKNSAQADALCTALFVMGWDGAVKFLQEHPELPAVLVDESVKKAAITKSAESLVRVTDPALKTAIIPQSGPVVFNDTKQ